MNDSEAILTVTQRQPPLETRLSTITSALLGEKGYISFVDVFLRLGYLSPSDYENWRFKRLPYLERAITRNRGHINQVMQTVRRNSLKGRLKPSRTVYMSWGKGQKVSLRFSQSGAPQIEDAYATHFVKP